MNTALWIVQVLLALIYAFVGWSQVFNTAKVKEQLPWAKKLSDNFIRFVGGAQVLGALGMLLPMLTGILPWLTPVAAIGLAIVQVLAIFTVHLPAKAYKLLPINLVLLALAIFVAYGRFFVLPQ